MASKKSPEDLVAQSNEEYYRELPPPFPSLPRPGHPVTDMALMDMVQPILDGVHALLLAQAEVFRTEALDVNAHHGSILLASQVELALCILKRWWEECDDVDRR